MTHWPYGPEKSSASVQGAGTLCIIILFLLLLFLLHRTNSDSALHTSAMNPNPQDPFGMNQQMGRGPPQRNGESNTDKHNIFASKESSFCLCVSAWLWSLMCPDANGYPDDPHLSSPLSLSGCHPNQTSLSLSLSLSLSHSLSLPLPTWKHILQPSPLHFLHQHRDWVSNLNIFRVPNFAYFILHFNHLSFGLYNI